MFKNLHLLKRGSIIFVRKDYSPTSWFIRKLTHFRYSHVALYLGVNKVLEADIGGVQINDFSTYLTNANFFGEVVDNPLPADKVDIMIKATLTHLKNDYDYSLLLGGILSKVMVKCNKNFILRMFDHAKSWVCSELIASGLREGGFAIKTDNLSPKQLYQIIKRQAKND